MTPSALGRTAAHALAAYDDDFTKEQREWLAQQFEGLTTTLEIMTPSTWAESKRYLPPSVTPLPGFYRFDVAPFLREIVDCFSVESPVRSVAGMKGAQVCFTTGVIENVIGYFIEHVSTAPMMMVTADAELAKSRLDSYIIPMLQASGLMHLIVSADEGNGRKTGKTEKKVEWRGGGFLIPQGAKNAAKMRSVSIQVLLRDEIDGWPDSIGNDGDPVELSTGRTKAYESSRKIGDFSTPLIKGMSKIAKRYALGDQRKYMVCCLSCGFEQELRWRHATNEHGEEGGIFWESDASGRLIAGSVRYRCCSCGHPHLNDDKTRLLSPEHGAHWKPTAVSVSPTHRSYHLSALYSPVGMQTWEACVELWLEAWDPLSNRPRDMEKLQVFYNNVLGEPFELRGEKLRYETVSGHRRDWYKRGEVPNRHCEQFCGGPVLVLVCTVDVHADNLAVSVWGWCRDRRAILIDYERFTGDTEQLQDPGTWGRLRKLVEEKVYVADDGKRYRIPLTLVDSGYRADTVYQFAYEYSAGVLPVKGQDTPPRSARIREFSEFTNPLGRTSWGITVDLYKDRWSAALRTNWDGMGIQPIGHFNAPRDLSDKELRELTAETKREKIEKSTGKRIGFEWHRPSGAANELWDCLMYANAGLDLLAWDVCRNQFQLEFVNWPAFYDLLSRGAYFTTG